MSSAIVPRSTMSTVSDSSRLTLRYAPGRSTTATSRPSWASMAAVRKTESSATVGDAASSLGMLPRCLLPSTTNLPLRSPVRFSLTVMIDSSAFAFSRGVSLAASRGRYTSRLCSCSSSFPTAFSVRPGYFRSAALKLYCVMQKWVTTAHWSGVRAVSSSFRVTRAVLPR